MKYGLNIEIIKCKIIFNYVRNKGTEDIPIMKKIGVYKLKCWECEIVFIGETGRDVQRRLREHKMGKDGKHTTNQLCVRYVNETKYKFKGSLKILK